MALLDTFSFVKSFRGASSEEEKAAAIASLVNGLVESNGAAAATRADLARVAGDVAKIEQAVGTLGEDVATPVRQQLADMSGMVARDLTAMRTLLDERVAALESKVEQLNKELGNRMEMATDRVGGSSTKVVIWTFLFFLLFALAGLYAAANWPMVNGVIQGLLNPPAAATAPAENAPAAPAANSSN
jgi:hypothetical protein